MPMNPMQMFGNMQNMMSLFQQFRNMIQQQGINPQQKVQELLQTGQMSQQQFEQLRQMANMFTGGNNNGNNTRF